MKSGEKKALWFVLGGVAVVAALTSYLEIQHQKTNPGERYTHSANAELKTAQVNMDTSMIPRGLDPNDLPDADSRGASLVILYCAQCHELPTPLMHSKEEWGAILKRMQERMTARRGGMLNRVMVPPERDWNVIATYLSDNAQQPLDAGDLPLLASTGGKLFQETCSQCHAMPDPRQHTAQEWPRVVLRMKANMTQAHKTVPDVKATQEIVAFLQSHGKSITVTQ